MGVVLSLFGAISLYKGGGAWRYLFSIGGAFAVLGLALPAVIKPVFRLWMKIAGALGWLNTRLLLSIVFFTVFTPVGLVARLFRIDWLDRKFPKPDAPTYWKDHRDLTEGREDPYERQF
ncbi:conserved hypothetical protein, membrane [sediment metagenome]|uniref:SxtJ n=1 Tax=sediment metagenome TaxID=749907 RepID=D9PJJ7_9ZZZZ